MMKFLIAVFLVVLAIANAEPPRFKIKSAKQTEAEAPYPPSGWKPTGAKFELPAKNMQYGAPSEVYGPPNTQVPVEETTQIEEETTTPPPGTQTQALKEQNQQGSFYVLLPNSRLQRLIFNVQSDPTRQQYSSKYQSTGVQQLSGPVFAQVYKSEYVQLS